MPQAYNTKITLDDSSINKLINAINDAADRILKNEPQVISQNSSSLFSAGIFDISGKNIAPGVKNRQTENNITETSIEEKTKKMLENFEKMIDNTQKILKTVGLIDNQIENFLSRILQMINSLSKGIDFAGSLFGFISNIFAPGSQTAAGILSGYGQSAANQLTPLAPGGTDMYTVRLNGKVLDDNLKREIAAKGLYLENMSVERNSYS